MPVTYTHDTFNKDVVDKIITVKNEDAIETARLSAKKEGLLIGISSGASLFAAINIAQKYPDKTILTLLPDSGERYLSNLFYEEM